MKTCSKCKVPKSEECFLARPLPSGNTSLRSNCKECGYKAHRVWAAKPESRELILQCQRKRYAANPEVFKEQVRRYRKKNPEKVKAMLHRHYVENKERHIAGCKKRVLENRERYSETSKRGARRRYANNPQARIVSALRTRLRGALHGSEKAGPTLELLGCPPVWLEAWLESLFRPGMTLANHGSVWHIDHIKPCAKFDLTDPEQQKICFHWTNLQPLFVRENLSKGDKYE